MNRPKAHHFIPQNQLSRFSNSNGELFFGIKESGRVIKSGTYGIMQEGELYSGIKPDMEYTSELESGFFSRLDGSWHSMLNEIVKITDNGELPELQGNTRLAFSQYVYNAYKRVPEVHKQSSLHKDPHGVVSDILNGELQNHSQKDTYLEKIQDPEFMRRLVKNATVKAVSHQDSEAIESLSKSAFGWLVPVDEDSHFIIGSKPVILKSENESDKSEKLSLGILFPLTKSLCLELTSNEDDAMFQVSRSLVDEINRRSFEQSRFCVGHDKSYIERLLKPQ